MTEWRWAGDEEEEGDSVSKKKGHQTNTGKENINRNGEQKAASLTFYINSLDRLHLLLSSSDPPLNRNDDDNSWR